jgi:hypothetical protein
MAVVLFLDRRSIAFWPIGIDLSGKPAHGGIRRQIRAPSAEITSPLSSGRSSRGNSIAMTKDTIELDARRGMMAQKATELRRLLSEVSANEETLRTRQRELEDQLLASPALSWEEAADKARYLLSLFASSLAGQDPRRQMLIARVLEDFTRLSTSPES